MRLNQALIVSDLGYLGFRVRVFGYIRGSSAGVGRI